MQKRTSQKQQPLLRVYVQSIVPLKFDHMLKIFRKKMLTGFLKMQTSLLTGLIISTHGTFSMITLLKTTNHFCLLV